MSAEEAELRSEPDKALFTIICRNGKLDVEGHGRIHVSQRRARTFGSARTRRRSTLEVDHPSYMAMNDIPNAIAGAAEGNRRRCTTNGRPRRAVQMMTGDFDGLIERRMEDGRDVCSPRPSRRSIACETEPHRRWSNGFSCFCFVLVGAPLADATCATPTFSRPSSLCFLPILVVYYPLLALRRRSGEGGPRLAGDRVARQRRLAVGVRAAHLPSATLLSGSPRASCA